MRKKKAYKKHIPLPDHKYNSVLVSKIINIIMKDGKKIKAQNIMYSALEIVKEKTKKDPLQVLEKAIENLQPQLEVRSRRVGGATYQVPVEVRPERALSLAIRWLVSACREQQGRPMTEKLADEIINAYNEQGNAIKKKIETHKMAESNKAFAHYRW
ncbi:MAG: 30S ribosomal protein S7 [Brevinematales bacterium]|nr:30S ribosomal protein S7 [Brevinematales bacterium]